MKTTPFEDHHRDGSIRAIGQMQNGIAVGHWEWFRRDGSKLRSGNFTNGMQSGTWVTYDKEGRAYKSTEIVSKQSGKEKVTLSQIKKKKK